MSKTFILSACGLAALCSTVGLMNPVSPAPQPDIDARYVAVHSCMDYVTSNLNDPESAQMPNRLSPEVIYTTKGDGWRVSFRFRAKNGFGSMRRGTAVCTSKDSVNFVAHVS